MMDTHAENTLPWTRFADDLPRCCTPDQLRLPRPAAVYVEASGQFGQELLWDLGLHSWRVRVGATWDGHEQAVEAAVQDHVAEDIQNVGQTADVLARHGVHLDDGGSAWVGQQDLVVAHIGSELAAAAGRAVLWTGQDLWYAADAEAGDLEQLVGPLIASDGDDDDLWCNGILEAWPGVSTDAVILLRAVNITPVMRGHRLGAWTAAQSIALFDQGSCLVATQAAPLHKRDAVPGLSDDAKELTTEESALWRAEQARLAEQWRTQLGLVPLVNDPTILTWHTSCTNETIKRTLSLWSE